MWWTTSLPYPFLDPVLQCTLALAAHTSWLPTASLSGQLRSSAACRAHVLLQS
jgi:hypothetical protein